MTSQYVLLFFCLLTSSSLLAASVDDSRSYGQLASDYIIDQWQHAMSELSALDLTAVPPDGVKSLRVSILSARELIDIFIYAYPNSTPTRETTIGHARQSQGVQGASTNLKLMRQPTEEIILAIRKQLDAGYESLGNFQDLAHSLVAYNESDLSAARSSCLSWRSSFLNDMVLEGFLGHLSQPSTTVLYHRKRSDLSPLFWGREGAPEPSLDLSGHANLALMTTSMISHLIEDLPRVLALPQVHAPKKNHERFHDYRKLVRSLLAVLGFFPRLLPPPPSHGHQTSCPVKRSFEIHTWLNWARCNLRNFWCRLDPFSSPECIRDPSSILQKTFKDLGQVNNLCFAWAFYSTRGDEVEAEKALRQVTARWESVRSWLVEVDMDGVLRGLKEAIEEQWIP